jgi:predicted ATPase/DNA-binding SARP family transcriptional activator
VHIRVLGPLELVDDAGAVTRMGSPTQRRLLALLVVHAGTVVSTDRIAEVLWGDRQPVNPNNALQGQVSRLRRALPDGVLLTRPPGYLLSLPALGTDVDAFVGLARQAREVAADGRAADAVAMLNEALGLWRGGAYAEFADEDFARAEAARIEDLRVAAAEDRVDTALALGDPADALARAEVLAAEHPLRERPHVLLMRALYQTGRQTEALAVHRAFRDRLDDELGLVPSATLQRLQGQILRHDPALDRPTSAPAPDRAPIAEPVDDVAPEVPMRPPIDLLGRTRDLAELVAALRYTRVVTLVGVGGVGKTLLALHAAADLAAEHPDGAALVELAGVRDPAVVADAVSTALGVQQRAALDVPSRLVEFLRPKRILLVLDNCEHLVAAVAGLVENVVARCPGVVVLATSREPLGVAGEQLRPLAPLEVPSVGIIDPTEAAAVPAVRLLLDRAAAAAPGFVLDAANLAAITETCRRLDGLPLAIELAAPRLRTMSPAELAARLDARFPLLRSGRRVADERQRTLRAVVDWSYDLLDERQRQVFDWLSVFAGPFTLEAAERLCLDVAGDAGDTANVVFDLVDRSMVVSHVARANRPSRYAMLETMRAYGQDRLADRGQATTARRAHAQWAAAFTASAEHGLQGRDEADWVEALTSAADDLRLAHRWALDHDLGLAVQLIAPLFWYAEFRSTEILGWAQRTIEVAERNGFAHPLLPVVYAMAAVADRFGGDLARTAALAATGVNLAGDSPTGWPARNLLADVAFFEGRLGDAETLFAQLAGDTAAAGQRYPLVVALWMRALTRAYRGDHQAALRYAEEAQTAAAVLDNPSMIAWASYTEAEALLDLDPDRAAALLGRAADLAATVGNRYLDGVARISAASLEARHGDPVAALRRFRNVLALWHEAGGWTQLWTAMRWVIDLLTRLHADHDAAILYGAVTSSPTASPAYGADAERLAATVDSLTRRLGADRLAAAMEDGAALDDDAAVAAATAMIEAATHSAHTQRDQLGRHRRAGRDG